MDFTAMPSKDHMVISVAYSSVAKAAPANTASIGQRHDFYFADADFATRIVLLEGKMPLFERFGEIQVFIELVAIHSDFDAGHIATAPHVVANFDFIGEPSVRLDELLIDMAEAVERAGADGVAMRAVDLGLVAVGERGLGRRAEVQPRIAAVVD